MEIYWYIIIAILLAVFFILDGYDFGVGIIHLFYAKEDTDKEVISKAAGLFWDSNEVWLVAGGGMLFMAFPILYASAFSGFYLPLIMVLWLIIFRAIGLEFRNKFNHSMWISFWDKAFGISSLLLALFFGIALGNVVRGVNLGGVSNGVSLYESHFFFLPLWSNDFSPLNESPGVIDWFTIIIGVIAVIALAIHGAAWIILKTNATINKKLKSVIARLGVILLILTIISLSVWYLINPKALSNFMDKPYLLIFPLLYFLGLFGILFERRIKKDIHRFLLSTSIILGGITSSLASMFPVVLPSTNEINESLTIYNTAASSYGMSVAFPWSVLGLLLIIIYFIAQRRFMSGKIDKFHYGH